MPEQPLTIRAATARDLDALRPRLSGLALLAEHHGRAVAAIALTSGRIAADASPARAEAVPRAAPAPLPAAPPGRRRRSRRARCCGASRPPPDPSPHQRRRSSPMHPIRSIRRARARRRPRGRRDRRRARRGQRGDSTCIYDPATTHGQRRRTTAAPPAADRPVTATASPSGTAPAARRLQRRLNFANVNEHRPDRRSSSTVTNSTDGMSIDESVGELGSGRDHRVRPALRDRDRRVHHRWRRARLRDDIVGTPGERHRSASAQRDRRPGSATCRPEPTST